MLTDEEWREFQSIPEQGYSHRAWVEHKMQLAASEAWERCRNEWTAWEHSTRSTEPVNPYRTTKETA